MPKRKLEEVIEEISSLKSSLYTPLKQNYHAPELHIPFDTDIDSPSAIFSLFFSNEAFQTINHSTNTYAKIKKNTTEDSDDHARSWQDTNLIEIKIFFAILIYMGVHDSQRADLYWRIDPILGPIHLPPKYMSFKRFEQIKRYLHISNPKTKAKDDKEWWYKLEPLASSLQESFKRYYTPGSNISIDEVMIRCFGRSSHTYKMPKKPIKQGYKVFGLAEHGYLWMFSWSSRQVGLMEMFKYPELSATGSMVMDMITSLPNSASNSCLASASNTALVPALNTYPGGARYSIYMDNYFTSVPLFQMLRERGYGVCGTARPRGLPPLLQELRNDHSKSLPWGTIYAIPMNDVLCLSWQDNNLVLGLSTIHSGETLVSRDRKRPGKTSTNASIVYKVFKDQAKQELDIPAFIDDYNHYMNGVDLANQYRAAYESHRSTRRNWLPILYWLLDVSIINAYRIHYIYKQQHNNKPLSQLKFRERLSRTLCIEVFYL